MWKRGNVWQSQDSCRCKDVKHQYAAVKQNIVHVRLLMQITLSFRQLCGCCLRTVKLSKEWQGVREWRKVSQLPDFVRLFHTSAPLRRVDLTKEWQGVRDWGKVWHYPAFFFFVRQFHTSTSFEKCRTRLRMKRGSGQGKPASLSRRFQTILPSHTSEKCKTK